MKYCLALIAIALILSPNFSIADTKEIIAEGTYNMGDAETSSVAEQRALDQAKRTALEQAGTYVESYSKVINYQLTVDEIRVATSELMEVEILDKKRTVLNDGITFWVKIKAKVNQGNIKEMINRSKDRFLVERYKMIQENYEKSKVEIEALKTQLTHAKGDNERYKLRQKILEEEKNYLNQSWSTKGYDHFQRNELDKAIEAFTSALKLRPDDAISYHDRGYAYGLKHLNDLEIADYNKSIEIVELKTTIRKAIKDQTAYDALLTYVRSWNYNDRGTAYLSQGNRMSAKEDFDKAITIDPMNYAFYVNRGLWYFGVKQYEDAIREFSKAIDLNKNEGTTYKKRGTCYLMLGQLDKSDADFTMANSKDTGN